MSSSLSSVDRDAYLETLFVPSTLFGCELEIRGKIIFRILFVSSWRELLMSILLHDRLRAGF